MSATRRAPATRRTTEAPTPRRAAALDGLEISLEQAQKALTQLQRDLSTGGRRLLKDVETAIKNARRDVRRSRKAIQSDLGDLGKALAPHHVSRKPAASSAKRKQSRRVPAAKA